MDKVLILLVLAIFSSPVAYSDLELTVDPSSQCPTITLICSATDFPATTLRWFIDDELFARYPYNPNDRCPCTVEPVNATFNEEIGGAEVHVLNATQTVQNQDIISFVSNITLNRTALEEAGVSNISCGSFAIKNTSSVTYRQVPAPTGVSIRPEYDEDLNLAQVQAMWNPVTLQDECRHIFSYHIAVVDEAGYSITDKEASSSSCTGGRCSTSLALSSSNQVNRLNITAISDGGRKSNAIASDQIYGSIVAYIKYTLVLEDCEYYFYCYSTLSETRNCSIQYGISGQQLSFPELVSSNSSFDLSLERSSVYNFQIEFTLNSTPVLIKFNYTSAKYVCLNSVQRGLIGGGIALLGVIIIIVLWILIVCLRRKSGVVSVSINTSSNGSNWKMSGECKLLIHDDWEERFIAVTNIPTLEIFKSPKANEKPEVYSQSDVLKVDKKEDRIEITLMNSKSFVIKPADSENLDYWCEEIDVLTFINIETPV